MIAIFTDGLSNVETLLNKVTILSSFTKGKTIIYEAQINSGDVFLIVVTGYGKANSAFGFGLALMRYDVEKVIGVGNCGSLKLCNTTLGEIAISTSAIQFDVDYSKLGYPKTLLPSLEESIYPADTALIELAKSASEINSCKFFMAKYASSDRFVASAKISMELKYKFDADVVENEAGSAGEIMLATGIPYVYVKGVSNFADYNAPFMYEDYNKMASEKACNIVYTMLLSLTAST
ncbi:MAG: 5'-methylthioadenosine/S-adenosylhomocysteine nucleosidase [Oscillospiraceae bacterium]